MIFNTKDEERFWSKVNNKNRIGCWTWNAAKCSGGKYGSIRLPGNKQVGAHVFSYLLNIGDIPKGIEVCHICDNGLCVRPDHLFLGTRQDNVDDMIKKGRQAKGEKLNHTSQCGELNNGSKLTLETILKIKELLKYHTQAEVAKITGAKRQNVWAIAHGKSWNHI